MNDEKKKPDFVNRQKGIAAWTSEYQGKKTLNIKIDSIFGVSWVTLYENEDKTTLDKAKEIVNKGEQPKVTLEKVE